MTLLLSIDKLATSSTSIKYFYVVISGFETE